MTPVLVLILCAALWLAYAVVLLRQPLRQAAVSWLVVLVGATGVALAAWRDLELAAIIAPGIVFWWLVLPTVVIRGVTRSLRGGRLRLANTLATLGMVVRPMPGQRAFRKAVAVSARIASGQEVDVDAAVASLGKLPPAVAFAHRLAFLAWQRDFEKMAVVLATDAARRQACRANMSAIVLMVLGETEGVDAVVLEYQRLTGTTALTRRGLDGYLALVTTAAHLGAHEVVRAQSAELRHRISASRLAFFMATAQQRAGLIEDAERTIEEASSLRGSNATGRRQLNYRRERVLAPDEPATNACRQRREEVLNDVSQRLQARQALLSSTSMGTRAAPATWAMTLSLLLCYVVQIVGSSYAAFSVWGLRSPLGSSDQAYRLLSYAMLHVDAGHLLANLVGLLIFGSFVESQLRYRAMLAIFTVGVLAGGLMFLVFAAPHSLAVGASGGVMALFAATGARIALDPRLRRAPEAKRERWVLGGVAALQLLADALMAQSSGSAHAGGLLAGLILGALFTRAQLKR